MRRCDDRLPLSEEPFAQTLSGKQAITIMTTKMIIIIHDVIVVDDDMMIHYRHNNFPVSTSPVAEDGHANACPSSGVKRLFGKSPSRILGYEGQSQFIYFVILISVGGTSLKPNLLPSAIANKKKYIFIYLRYSSICLRIPGNHQPTII